MSKVRIARLAPAGAFTLVGWAALLVCGAAVGRADTTVTDGSVDRAIQEAVAYLKSQRNTEGHWEKHELPNSRFWAGDTALVCLALLYAGEDPRHEYLSSALSWLAAQPMKSTYCYGVRAHALALTSGRTYRGRLEEDLRWLLAAIIPRGQPGEGAYGYEEPRAGSWDNSNSQYGVLGVWMAGDAGLEAPQSYWQLVAEHWLRVQNSDGGWAYMEGQDSNGSMTVAGLASLFVVLDKVYSGRTREAGLLMSGIERGLNWLGQHFTAENPYGDAMWRYYYLYGVERVGRASGQKYFRGQPWFRIGAEYLQKNQARRGNWPGGGHAGELRNTAFGLMFLCHGRAPLTFNKLEHGDDWNSKPRDVAGFTRYAGHAFERLLNWQVVQLDSPMEDLLEAPVLYLCGESAWEFSDTQVEKLREYCLRGGLLLGVCAQGREDFARGFESLARRALPEHPLRRIGPEHPLLTGELQFAIKSPPPLYEAHSGVRPMMLLCKADIAEAWNRYNPRGPAEDHFKLACNIYLYATDKTTLRSRLETPVIPVRPTEIRQTIRLARIRHSGHWDVEPFGWTRLAAHLNNVAGTRLLVSSGVPLDSEELAEFKVAYLAGTGAFTLTATEQAGLRRFLSGGGTLLADAAAGSAEFVRALEQAVGEALKSEPLTIPQGAPLLTGEGIPDGTSLAGLGLRRAARGEARGQPYPRLRAFLSGARYAVIYSPLDLSAGLLGTHVYNLRGYDANGSLKILQNLVLYAGLPTAQKARLRAE